MFELTGDAGVESEVAGVMGTRGEFVDDEAAVFGDEKLNTEDTDNVEDFENGASDVDSGAGDGIGNAGGRERDMENAVAVLVLDGAVVDESAVGRAGGDDRNFAVEINKGFEDGFFLRDGDPGG